MDYLIKIALTGIVVSILIFLLKGFKSDFAPALAVVGSVVLLGAVLTLIDGAADAVKELFQSSELESEHVKNLLKIIGAAYIVDFSASLCRDMGEASMASKITSLSIPFSFSIMLRASINSALSTLSTFT